MIPLPPSYLRGVALTAALDPHGGLVPVGEASLKLRAAFHWQRPRIHTVVVAKDQQIDGRSAADDPDAGVEDASFRIIAADTLAEAQAELARDYLRRFAYDDLLGRDGFLDAYGRVTGRAWLAERVEAAIEALSRGPGRKGYVTLLADPGFGKTAFCVALADGQWGEAADATMFIRRQQRDEAGDLARRLVAQLGMRFGLRRDDLLPPADERLPVEIVRDALTAVSKTVRRGDAAGGVAPVRIVVDGVDEACGPSSLRGTAVGQLLPRPESLPEGVVVVLGSRYFDGLQGWCGDGVRTIDLREAQARPAADRARMDEDLRSYIRGRMEALATDEAFAATGVRFDPAEDGAELAPRLIEACEGLFIVAERLIGPNREIARLAEDLAAWHAGRSIPRGLEGWLNDQWKRIEERIAADAKDESLPRDRREAARRISASGLAVLLGLLAESPEPLGRAHLEAVLPQADPDAPFPEATILDSTCSAPTRFSPPGQDLDRTSLAAVSDTFHDRGLRYCAEYFTPGAGAGAPYLFFHTSFREWVRTRLWGVDDSRTSEDDDLHPLLRRMRMDFETPGSVKALHRLLTWGLSPVAARGLPQRDDDVDTTVADHAVRWAVFHALKAGEHEVAADLLTDPEHYLPTRVGQITGKDRPEGMKPRSGATFASVVREYAQARRQWPKDERAASAYRDLDVIGTVMLQRRHALELPTPLIQELWEYASGVLAAPSRAKARLEAAAESYGGNWLQRENPETELSAEVLTLRHDGPVNSVAVWPEPGSAWVDRVPEGMGLILTASDDHTARIWDLESGEPLGEPMLHDDSVTHASFSPSGDRVVTASVDGTARLWDGTTGAALGEPMVHDGPVLHASFSPSGDRVVTASGDGTARLWDGTTGGSLCEPMCHTEALTVACFSPGGERVLTASWDGTAQLWNASTGTAIGKRMLHLDAERDAGITDASFNATGDRVVTSSAGSVRLWDGTDGSFQRRLKGLVGEQFSARFIPGGNELATVSNSGDLAFWDGGTGAPQRSPLGLNCVPEKICFSPRGDRLLLIPALESARLCDVDSHQPALEFLDHGAPLSHAIFDGSGNLLVVASEDGVARVLAAGATATSRERVSIADPFLVNLSPDESRVVSVDENQTVILWNIQTGRRIGAPLEHGGTALGWASFSPDSASLVTGCPYGRAWLWDTGTGELISSVRNWGALTSHVSAGPRAERLLTASQDGTARLWNGRTGEIVGQTLRHEDWVLRSEFSPTGHRVVTASADLTARMWCAQTGAPCGEPMLHESGVAVAKFDATGEKLVTGSWDRTAKLWEGSAAKKIGTTMEHDGAVADARFNSDGTLLVTASGDGTARLWDSRNGSALGEPMRHAAPVMRAWFARTDRGILTLDANGALRFWDLECKCIHALSANAQFYIAGACTLQGGLPMFGGLRFLSWRC